MLASRSRHEPPKPEEPTFTVAGGFLKTKEKAKETRSGRLLRKLHEYLLQQDPPVKRMPTFEMVQTMLIKHPGASEADAEIGKVTAEEITDEGGKPETMYKVEVAVKVRPEHVRELRSQERSSEALWVLAGLGGLAAVIAVFFKIDSWTKGYLTSWLVLGTVGDSLRALWSLPATSGGGRSEVSYASSLSTPLGSGALTSTQSRGRRPRPASRTTSPVRYHGYASHIVGLRLLRTLKCFATVRW